MDSVTLFSKLINQKPHDISLIHQFKPCDTCNKPDVYLIVADEYAGKNALQDLFSFDNSPFETQLKNRGFHVVQNTKANYNATVYSMASMLNMDYIQNLESTTINHGDMFICRAIINDNNVVSFFKKMGYTVSNLSCFSFDNSKNIVDNPFFIKKEQLFTAQTFTNRIRKDLGFHLASPQQIETLLKQQHYNNKKLDSLTRQVSLIHSKVPKFVYTHLVLPHHPYFTDSNGKEVSVEKLTATPTEDKNAYVEYLIYANKKLLALIDHIQHSSQRPPIIILIGDHGFRQFLDNTDKKYYFMNLNAVYFPDGNYSQFYDGMSNVNQFRVLLNSQFGQKLPLLKDSISFLYE